MQGKNILLIVGGGIAAYKACELVRLIRKAGGSVRCVLTAGGAQFIASKLEALAANPDLWNSTVFVLDYDENDGFFDHVPPPTPDPRLYPEEFVHVPSPKGTPGGGLPIGAGFRVPSIVISPWTVGGRIFSDVSDHTSILRLIEAVAAGGGLVDRGQHAPASAHRVAETAVEHRSGAFA